MNSMLILVLIGVTVSVQLRGADSAQCACATGNVNVRNGAGAGHAILHTLLIHHCLPFKGHHKQDGSGGSWANVNYHGQDGWVSEHYIHITTKTSCAGTTSGSGTGTGSGTTHHVTNHLQLPGCPHIIPRREWHARAPKNPIPKLTHTPKYMFIHHGASAPCHTKADCIQRARSYQTYHMDSRGWPDIGYSFLVGEDGHVYEARGHTWIQRCWASFLVGEDGHGYEARGWNEVGAHTLWYNDVGLAICVIGNFMDHVPNDAALHAVKQLIQCAHDNHKIAGNYVLRGHRDMGQTSCPGTKLYNVIKHWAHY